MHICVCEIWKLCILGGVKVFYMELDILKNQKYNKRGYNGNVLGDIIFVIASFIYKIKT